MLFFRVVNQNLEGGFSMRKNKKHCHAVKSGTAAQVIGMVANMQPSKAKGFLAGVSEVIDPNAATVFLKKQELCIGCLHNFIEENNVTTLFLDKDLSFMGGSVGDAAEVIKYVLQFHNCETYLISNSG
jgi:hypothetical protein